MKTIAIIGSSGTNARPWTDAFLAAGWHVRGLVRDPRKIGSQPHLTATTFDFGDPQSHAPALAGVDVLALISPAQPNQVAWESALIAAAQRAAVGSIIKLSVLGAEMAKPISFFARNAAETEEVLRGSAVPHVILRANGFMQNVLRQRATIEAGNFVEPSGATAASRIDVHDLASRSRRRPVRRPRAHPDRTCCADGRRDGRNTLRRTRQARALCLTVAPAIPRQPDRARPAGVADRCVRRVARGGARRAGTAPCRGD
jgi:uncharacterized protein YbjT (DUF2867 family)